MGQLIHKFQEHLAKINNINYKIQQIPYHQNHANLQKWLHDYTDQFQKDFNELKKFCEIENLEKRLITLHLDYEQLQQESKKKIEDQNKKIDQLKEFEKDIQLKLRIYGDDNQFLNNQLIEVQNNYDNQLKEEQIKNQSYIQKLNQKISSQDSIINQVNKELDLRIQMFEPIIKLKPKLLKEDFWIQLFFVLQEKCKKKITSLGELKLDCNNNSSFWKGCNDKSNLLIIFKSLSRYIFGGYSPYLWNQNKGFAQDDTLSSFLFSQTHDQIYQLKQDKKQYVIWCGYSYGPCFGSNDDGQHDIVVKADFQGGYSQLGNAYLWDKSENKRSSHLYGQDSPNLTECEIFELKFS